MTTLPFHKPRIFSGIEASAVYVWIASSLSLTRVLLSLTIAVDRVMLDSIVSFRRKF